LPKERVGHLDFRAFGVADAPVVLCRNFGDACSDAPFWCSVARSGRFASTLTSTAA